MRRHTRRVAEKGLQAAEAYVADPHNKKKLATYQKAQEKFLTAVAVESGVPEGEARAVARVIFGGDAGRILLEICHGVADDD